MNTRNKTIGLALILIAALATACGPATQIEPTPDLDKIRTEAVQTAKAELTMEAKLNPPATEVPPTITPFSTATQEAPLPKTGPSSSGSSGSSGGSGGSSGTPIPTWTPVVYACEIINQSPWDRTVMTGSIFDVVWTVKNVGIGTWNTAEYYVKRNSDTGIDGGLTHKDQYKLRNDVAPYQTYDVIVDISVSVNPSDDIQYTEWGIVNDNGEVFCKFYFAIPYTFPAPTRTPTEKP